MKELTVREAARQRYGLDGADAQALEHALTQVESQRDALAAEAATLRDALKWLMPWIVKAVENDAFSGCVSPRGAERALKKARAALGEG